MSSPTPSSDSSSSSQPAARFRRGQLVAFDRDDDVTGRRERGTLGVVLGAPDGEPVVIRPLSADTVFVPASDVTSASVGSDS